MSQKDPEPFTDLTLPSFFPQHEVAEHEVLLSFRNDDDGIAFREWWEEEGAVLFNDWLKRQPKKGE